MLLDSKAMAALLPIACYFLLFELFRRNGLAGFAALRGSALCWVALVVVIIEALSGFDALSRLSVVLAWSGVDAVLFVLVLRQDAGPSPVSFSRWKLERPEQAMCAAIAAIIALTAALGAASAPNNWDSMVYHLSRVMPWMSNRSVAVYPTNSLTQLYHHPWADWVLVH